MSIKKKHLVILKDKFIFQSEYYKNLIASQDKLKEKIREIIQKDIDEKAGPEIMEILSKLDRSTREVYFYLGTSFRDRHGGITFPDENELKNYCPILGHLHFEVPLNYTTDIYGMRDLSEKIISEIRPLNDEFLRLEMKKSKLENAWERLINGETSLVWLKNEFPDVYEYLSNNKN